MFQAEKNGKSQCENIKWINKDQDTKQYDLSYPMREGLSAGAEGAFCWDYIEDYTAHLIALCLAVYVLNFLANYKIINIKL